jgi:hypothetical protein
MIMGEKTFVDLDILADMGTNYLVSVSKAELRSLVSFDDSLSIRHWDGEKPLVLESYGEMAVRTTDDETSENNLTNLPNVDLDDVHLWLMGEED